MRNPLKIFQYIFGGIGAVTLIIALILFANTRSFLSEAQRAPGVILELVASESDDSTVYHPVVGYQTPDGENRFFQSSVGSNPPAYEEGEKVEVLYSPSKPDDARINSFFSLWGGALIVGGLGSIFFAVGAGLWLIVLRGTRREARLRKLGHVVEAAYLRVEKNTSLELNGANPWRIVCQWQDPKTTKLHMFFSQNLWFNPESRIDRQSIPVFIDPLNPQSYFVDTSFLPELAD
ncbi:DUF3592 domain-containing protein [Uliginosibacterium sp. 31-16]|uniref:DUF3592 domain-containing protein n=1 Tax=Uliginosibacterium sp. 31-16 TaxID=3068315 RepID=UPI00273E227B|nr:DUF3592 domain-containing protein [Uliginosibacterium sp. 31-16]MDP5240807.1 DUF3592 domain-containing protein [Uliginosibacterium sp. 31-16]